MMSMEFDLHRMNMAARDLLAGVEEDVALMHEHGHVDAAKRTTRRVERFTGVSAKVRTRLAAVPDHAGENLNAVLDELERRLDVGSHDDDQ